MVEAEMSFTDNPLAKLVAAELEEGRKAQTGEAPVDLDPELLVEEVNQDDEIA